jgi:hypothetical protein
MVFNQSRSRKGTCRNGGVGMENKKECPYRKEIDFSLWCKRTCRYCTLEQRKTCNVKKEAIKITNADRIRSMTDEELAEFLDDIAYYCKGRQNETYCSNCRFYFLGECNCISIGEWLKSEVGCE